MQCTWHSRRERDSARGHHGREIASVLPGTPRTHVAKKPDPSMTPPLLSSSATPSIIMSCQTCRSQFFPCIKWKGQDVDRFFSQFPSIMGPSLLQRIIFLPHKAFFCFFCRCLLWKRLQQLAAFKACAVFCFDKKEKKRKR